MTGHQKRPAIRRQVIELHVEAVILIEALAGPNQKTEWLTEVSLESTRTVTGSGVEVGLLAWVGPLAATHQSYRKQQDIRDQAGKHEFMASNDSGHWYNSNVELDLKTLPKRPDGWYTGTI
jgi:hypothetical protein